MSDGSNGIAGDQIRAIIERVERLEEEKRTIAEDVKEVYAEAKGNGLDAKVIRKIVSLRRKQLEARREEAAVMSLYLEAIGMQGELPL